jgi:hypothetical protein
MKREVLKGWCEVFKNNFKKHHKFLKLSTIEQKLKR